MDNGIHDYFDHADIYGRGTSEEIFGEAFKELGIARDSVMLQTKCGIVPGVMFDFSKEHIIASVEGSLKRLQTDYVDALLLHRPDTLMEPEEVAEAFDALHKARESAPFRCQQPKSDADELLKAVTQPLLINQLQLSLTHAPMIDAGFNVNMMNQSFIHARRFRPGIQPDLGHDDPAVVAIPSW